MATKRDRDAAFQKGDASERPLKKAKSSLENKIEFSLAALLGSSNVIGRNQIAEYERAVKLLEQHNAQSTTPNEKSKNVAVEARKDLDSIKDPCISIAIVGPAGQGKSTFGNRFLWALGGDVDIDDDDRCNFPLVTSCDDHQTNRSIYCKTSKDGSWSISLTLHKKGNFSHAEEKLSLSGQWNKESVRTFLQDPRQNEQVSQHDWNSIISIHVEGPFELDKGITLIDTPGWNFNFGDQSEEKTLDKSLKLALRDATVLIHLSIAPRIHGKDDIQTLLEKTPPRDKPPVIVAAWGCQTAPQRHHAEKLRHALQTLKSDTALNTDEDVPPTENLSDPWERYQLFDQMMQNTMLFTVPYSFDHMTAFLEQIKDAWARPTLIKLHWEFKTFTLLGKRSKKDATTSEAVKIAKYLETQRKSIEPMWDDEKRILDGLEQLCDLVWEDTIINAKMSSGTSTNHKPYWNTYQNIGSSIVTLRQTALLIYTKLFMKAVQNSVELNKPIETLNLIELEGEDSEIELDTPTTNTILSNEFYQSLEGNFKQKFLLTFLPKKAHKEICEKLLQVTKSFKPQILPLFQKEISIDSSPVIEIDNEADSYKEVHKKFTKELSVVMEEVWKRTIAHVKKEASGALDDCIGLLREKWSDALEKIADCIKGLKSDLKSSNIAAAPLTAKDPLVHINRIGDMVSHLDQRIITSKKSRQIWKANAIKIYQDEGSEQIINVSKYFVDKTNRSFEFSYGIHKSTEEKIEEFSKMLNTSAALDKTLFPMFVISSSLTESWMNSRKKLFRLSDLDLNIIGDQFLMFLIIPKTLVSEYQKLINDQLKEGEPAKNRIYFVLLDAVDENTSPSLWLDVAKCLAEEWKFSFYWRLSHNVFYPMSELDMANFGRRPISLARGLLIMQNIVHQYRYYVVQEISKIFNEKNTDVALTRFFGSLADPLDTEKFILVKNKNSFVSFADVIAIVDILERNELDEMLTGILHKLTSLLQKIGMICAVDDRNLYQKLAMCFPYLFSVETSPSHQTRFLSLNNTYAQKYVLSRPYNTNSLTESFGSFWAQYKEKDKKFAERCKSERKSLAIITPYVVYKDSTSK